MAQKPKQKRIPPFLLLLLLLIILLVFVAKKRSNAPATPLPQASPIEYSALYKGAELPKYPNAEIIKTSEGETLESGIRITLTTQDSVKDVASFFESEMRKLGWTPPRQTLSVDDLYLGTFTKESLFYQVTISRVEGAGQTQISIVLGEEN